ncbi:MAG: M56 family metallopeptidase [Bacteroidota bacterium]
MDLFIEISVKSLFIAAFGCGLCWLLRKESAYIRHWMISLTAVGLLLLPVAILLGPSLPLIPEEALPKVLTSTVEAPELGTAVQGVNDPMALEETSSAGISSQEEANSPVQSIPIYSILGGLWALGAFLLLGKMIMGIWRIYQISQQAQAVNLSPLSQHEPYSNTLIKVSAEVHSPMTWGIFKPEILLPSSTLTLSEEEIHTILLHEWTHIQRKDYLLHLLCLMATSLHWINPFAWVLKKKHVIEREKACDEQMIRGGKPASEYASQLVSVARKLTRPSSLQDHVAIQMAKGSQIKQRVVALINDNPAIPLPSRKMLANYGLLFACWIPLLAAISPVSPAKEIPVLQEVVAQAAAETPFQIFEKSSLLSSESQVALPLEQAQPLVRIENTPQLEVASLDVRRMEASPVAPETAAIKQSTGQAPSELKSGKALKWTNGNYEYQLWTYGNVQSVSNPPYVKFEKADDILVVTQRKKGKPENSVKLILSPAPYDGNLIQSYMDGVPNSFSWHPKGDVLELWYKEGKWVFLARGTIKESKKILPMVAEQLRTEEAWVNQETNPNWWRTIQENIHIKGDRFFQEEKKDLSARLGKAGLPSYNTALATNLNSLPVLIRSIEANSIKKGALIGKNAPTKTSSGFNNPKKYSGGLAGDGTTFGTAITYSGSPVRVNQLHFHVRHNGYKRISFEANLYEINEGRVTGKINPSPILFGVENIKGWVTADLSTPVTISSDVLVTLKVVDGDAKGRSVGLFLSHDDSSYESMEDLTGQKDWGIWEGNFSFYLSHRE